MHNNNHLFTGPTATKLENLRAKAREKRIITYDCFNARLREGKVVCNKGYKFKGNLSLLSVLKGQSTRTCHKCPDFDTEVENV